MNDYCRMDVRSSTVLCGDGQWNFSSASDVLLNQSSFYFNSGNMNVDGNDEMNVAVTWLDISSGNLAISNGSSLTTEDSDFIIRNGGSVLIENHLGNVSHYYYNSGTNLVIKESDSRLTFHDGQLHIPADMEFTVTYPYSESGFIEILPGTENMLVTGVNSTFALTGSDMEDVVLHIAPGAHLQNPNFGAGTIKLLTCKVDMTGRYIYVYF